MSTLKIFLSAWEEEYSVACARLDIFNPEITAALSPCQKTLFASSFYHIRGHFFEFLCRLASRAPSNTYKQVILANITEELGEDLKSHEQLYAEFAYRLDVDTVTEFLTPSSNFDYTEYFNKAHLEWILSKDWGRAWAAFCAYERLDNVDYRNLYALALSFNVDEAALLFFKVHAEIGHFDATFSLLEDEWRKDPQAIKDGFQFIAQNQLLVWQNLNNTLFA